MPAGARRSVSKDVLATALLIAAAITLVALLRVNRLATLAVVSSWSMEPVLHVGDVVVSVRMGEYRPGDIALYQNDEGKIIVHRIINETTAGRCVLKGDANAYPDRYTPLCDELLGKVVVVVPFVGVYKLLLPAQLP